MAVGRIIDIFYAIVVVAGITAVLASKNTASIIEATTSGFARSITAAQGR